MNSISIFKNHRSGRVQERLSLFGLIEHIRTDERLITLFNNGLSLLKESNPDKYRKIKDSLRCCYIGSDSGKYDEVFNWNGYIQFDLDDNNTREEYEAFRLKVLAGEVSYIKALAYSASGPTTGAQFAVAEFNLDLEIVKDHSLFDDLNGSKLFKKLYKKAAELVGDRLKKEYGIIIAENSLKHKQLRYLSPDPGAYYTSDNYIFNTKELINYCEATKESDALKRMNKNLATISEFNIEGGGWIQECLRYVHSKNTEGKDLKEDGRRIAGFNWGVKANLFGIPFEMAEMEFDKYFGPINKGHRMQIKSAYDSGEDYHGIHAQQLLIEQYETIELPRGEEYLTYAKDRIIESLESYKKVSLIAPTGSGKNYFSCHHLAPSFNGKTILVLSLNKKVFKDAAGYGCKYPLTGEHIEKAKDKGMAKEVYLSYVIRQDLILCNANQSELLINALEADNPDVNIQLIVDESQTFGKSYRENGYNKLYKAFNNPIVKRTLFMTGTAIVGFKDLGFHLMKVVKEKAHINISVKIAGKRAISNVIEEISNSKERENATGIKDRVLFRINNKETIESIYDYLTSTGILRAEEIVKIYTGQEDDYVATYADRLNNAKSDGESFDDSIRLILATAAIEEGIDIYTQGNILTVAFENRSIVRPDSIVQLFDRWRTNNPKNGVIYIPSLSEAKGFNNFNPLSELRELKSFIETNISMLNAMPESMRGGKSVSVSGLFGREIKLINWSERDKKYSIEFASVLGYIYDMYFEKATLVESVQFFANNYKYLKFDFSTYDTNRLEANEDYLLEEDIENVLKGFEKTKLIDMNDLNKVAVDLIIDAEISDNNKLLKRIKKQPLSEEDLKDAENMRPIIKKMLDNPSSNRMLKRVMHCMYDVEDLGFNRDDAMIIAKDPKGKDPFVYSRIDDFVSGYKKLKLMQEADIDATNLNRIELLQVQQFSRIMEAFEIGQTYTSDQILDLSKSVLHKNEKKYMSFTKKNCKDNIKQLFKHEEKRKGTSIVIVIKDYENIDGFCSRYGIKSIETVFDQATSEGIKLASKGNELDMSKLDT